MTLIAARLPGQDRSLETTVRSIPRPEGQKLRNPLPRPVLLLQARVREKECLEGRWCTYLYDPANPRQGARKIFEGQEGSYLRVLTPLFGGIGVAIATEQGLNQESKSEMFWMDLLKGRRGPSIASRFGRDWSDGSNFFFESPEGLHYFEAAKGALSSYHLAMTMTERIGEHTLLGISGPEGKRRVAKVDLRSGQLQDFGELPEGLQDPSRDWDSLSPMGEDAKDGVVYIKELASSKEDHFEFWCKPTGHEWRRLLADVPVWKTFGGRRAWLPCVYLGDRRFAVARTLLDAPRTGFVDGQQLPQGGCSTLRVDGLTGHILEETSPLRYDHNPRLDIPETWWSVEEAAARKRAKEAQADAIGFRWDEKARLLCFPDGRPIPDSSDAAVSADRKLLALVDPPLKTGSLRKQLPVRILEARTGAIQRFVIRVKAEDASIQAIDWQWLCSASPSAEELRFFAPSEPDLFCGPWR